MTGLVSTRVSFAGRAPDPAAVAAKARELCGLPLAVTASGAAIKGELYDQHAALAFACALDEWVTICADRPGAVRALVEGTFGAALPAALPVQGLHEPEGTQVVYLRGLSSTEPTLLFVVLLALEALGGQLAEPLTEEERRRYGGPITEAQLLARRREARRGAWLVCLIVLVLLPVLVPLWMLWFCLVLVRVPGHVRDAHRLYREIEGRSRRPE